MTSFSEQQGWELSTNQLMYLGGGFKYFLCSPRKLGKIPIVTHIFQRGWFNHQLGYALTPSWDPCGSKNLSQDMRSDTSTEGPEPEPPVDEVGGQLGKTLGEGAGWKNHPHGDG